MPTPRAKRLVSFRRRSVSAIPADSIKNVSAGYVLNVSGGYIGTA